MMNELGWLSLPVAGILSMIAGSDLKFPGKKLLRKVGIPLLFVALAWWTRGFMWRILIMGVAQFGSYTMPFTLKGDDVHDHWFNWAWILVYGWSLCSAALVINLSIWPVALAATLVWSTLAILSNCKATARWVPWKFVEFFSGACPAYVLCLAL